MRQTRRLTLRRTVASWILIDVGLLLLWGAGWLLLLAVIRLGLIRHRGRCIFRLLSGLGRRTRAIGLQLAVRWLRSIRVGCRRLVRGSGRIAERELIYDLFDANGASHQVLRLGAHGLVVDVPGESDRAVDGRGLNVLRREFGGAS